MPHVEEAIVRLGSRLSYGEAEEELERMWRVKVPKSTVRNTTLKNGQIADQLIKEQVAQLNQGEGEESLDVAVDQLVRDGRDLPGVDQQPCDELTGDQRQSVFVVGAVEGVGLAVEQ